MIKKIDRIYDYLASDIDRLLLIALVFSIPFDRIPSFDIFGATIRISVMISIMIIARSAYLLITRKKLLKFSTQEKLLSAFILWIILLIPEAMNFTRALQVVTYTIFAALTAISVSIIFDKKYIKPIVYSLFISASFTLLIGIYQYVGDLFGLPISLTGLRSMYSWQTFGFPRIQAASLEPLYYASYLLIPLLAAMSVKFTEKQKIISPKITNVLIYIFSLGLFMTVSRGGVYGMIAAIVFSALIMASLKKFNLRIFLSITSVITLAFLTSLIIINYFNKPPEKYLSRGAKIYVNQISDAGLDSGNARSIARANAISILNTNKSAYIIGIGPGQYGPYSGIRSQDGGYSIINNLVLEVLLEYGLVGLIIISLFVAYLCFKLYVVSSKTKDRDIFVISLATILFLVSQAVQYQSFSTLYIMHTWVVIGIAMAIIRYYGKNTK